MQLISLLLPHLCRPSQTFMEQLLIRSYRILPRCYQYSIPLGRNAFFNTRIDPTPLPEHVIPNPTSYPKNI
ncbi:hypothetical protein HOY82DRAFT_561859 [Tuber indicum]|nr:hypothetical protein HOY82DRAFT_561859 [Tuber indicum]